MPREIFIKLNKDNFFWHPMKLRDLLIMNAYFSLNILLLFQVPEPDEEFPSIVVDSSGPSFHRIR